MSNTLAIVQDTLKTSPQTATPYRAPDFSREQLAKLFCNLGFRSGAEIGVHVGYFSDVLVRANPFLSHLYCVDIWERPEFYERAKEKLLYPPCHLFRMDSVLAAKLFADNSLDFVYIDDDHTDRGVSRSMTAWEPKVRSGGIVAGHDYKIANHTRVARRCKVVQAVNRFVENNEIRQLFVIGENLPSWPSWFFIKN